MAGSSDIPSGDEVLLGSDLAYTPRFPWSPRERLVYASASKNLACFGESRSGKSSISGAYVTWAAPYIQRKELDLYCMDLKGGVEANMIPDCLRKATATNADEALELMKIISDEIDRRTAYLRQNRIRKVRRCPETPTMLLYADEMNDLMRQGSKTKALKEQMEHLLSMGAAEGLLVVGLAQDATKEAFPWRPLFQQRIALRMERGMATLALGDLAKVWGAKPWRISTTSPGEGYMLDYEEHHAVHFQAFEVTDDDLSDLERYAPPIA